MRANRGNPIHGNAMKVLQRPTPIAACESLREPAARYLHSRPAPSSLQLEIARPSRYGLIIAGSPAKEVSP